MLSAVILTKDERSFILKNCVDSVYELADEIIIIDSNGKDSLAIQEWYGNDKKIRCFVKRWRDAYSYTDSRNFGIEASKGDWVLNLDSDEILGDKKFLIKDYIKKDCDAISLTGHHFVYNLATEDATLPTHVWRNRLTKRIQYPPNTMHGLPRGSNELVIAEPIIYHFGYVKGLYCYMRNKWKSEKARWEIHREETYKKYCEAVLKGTYPVKSFNGEMPIEIQRDWI